MRGLHSSVICGDSPAGRKLAAIWALLSQLPACYDTCTDPTTMRSFIWASPTLHEFQQCVAKPPDRHVSFPKRREEVQLHTDSRPARLRSPLPRRSCRGVRRRIVTLQTFRYLRTVCDSQTPLEGQVNSVIGCPEPFADPCRGRLQSVADTIKGSSPDPVESSQAEPSAVVMTAIPLELLWTAFALGLLLRYRGKDIG